MKATLQVGTIKFKHLARFNEEIRAHNKTFSKRQKKDRKYQRKPNQVFKAKDFAKDTRKGSLDFGWYAFEVYYKELILYAAKIAQVNYWNDRTEKV